MSLAAAPVADACELPRGRRSGSCTPARKSGGRCKGRNATGTATRARHVLRLRARILRRRPCAPADRGLARWLRTRSRFPVDLAGRSTNARRDSAQSLVAGQHLVADGSRPRQRQCRCDGRTHQSTLAFCPSLGLLAFQLWAYDFRNAWASSANVGTVGAVVTWTGSVPWRASRPYSIALSRAISSETNG